ncbi:MAG: hypothetical protein ACRDQ9_16495, partial [Pseudonocardiaceae bacterium]
MPILAPERRTRWDLAAAGALAALVLAVSSTLWWTSDARRTTLVTAPGPAPRDATAAGSAQLTLT